MSKNGGKNAKVMYGSVVVAEQVEWSLSGFVPDVQESTVFGNLVKKFKEAGAGDPGTLSFNGDYDPADTTGQAALAVVCEAGGELTNLYLYENVSTFWRVGSGGAIIITKAKAITRPKSGFGKISFEGRVSGASMEQVGVGT